MKKSILFFAVMALGFISHGQLFQVDEEDDEQEVQKEVQSHEVEIKNIDTVGVIYTGVAALGINQGILHNGASGGELASLTANGFFNGNLTYYHHRSVWTTSLDLAYGLFYAESESFKPQKTDDRFDLTSKYGYRLTDSGNIFITGLFNTKSQFTKGYDYEEKDWESHPNSKFLSPLYMIAAAGIEYRKGSQFSVFFSPVAARTTFVSKYFTNQMPEGAYGVEYGKSVRLELGSYISARYIKDLNKNITYRGRVDLYSNYLAKNVYDDKTHELIKKDNPGNIDILLENAISFRFFKYFSMNLGIQAIYDNDVPYSSTYKNDEGIVMEKNEPKAMKALGWWQIKQVLSFGFNYKF